MRLLLCFAVFILLGLVSAPARCLGGAEEAISLCIRVIIPSLFPFFVCSSLLIETGGAQKIGRWLSFVMRPLFNVPGSAGIAFVLGILSGYPVGAKCGVDLYERNLCTKAEAQRIVCFCNNSGPLFIIGSVGAGMIFSQSTGLLLYAIHVLSAISTGLVFRFYKKNERMTLKCAEYRISASESRSMGEAFANSVSRAVELIFYVCGFIIFFGVFMVILEHFKVIAALQSLLCFVGVPPEASRALCYGFFEISTGAVRAASLPVGQLRLVILSAILAWSGISVILQVAGILQVSGLSARVFVASKLVQAAFAAFYALALTHLPIGSAPVFVYENSSIFNSWLYSFALLGIAAFIMFIVCMGYLILKSYGAVFVRSRRN